MLMLTDSASLKSVDAISAHNIDTLPSGDVHNLPEMNAGTHPKVIRLDRNQQRENRFWRKQRVREKKQRKWEEQVRKQKEEEDGVPDGENAEVFSDNDPADDTEDGDATDEMDSDDVPEGIGSTAPDEENAADSPGDGLGDSGYRAEENEEQQEPLHTGEEESAMLHESRHRSDGDVAEEDDGNHSLDEADRDSPETHNEERMSYEENVRKLSEEEQAKGSDEAHEEGGQPNEPSEEGVGENETDEKEDEQTANLENENNNPGPESSDDVRVNSSAAVDGEDAEARPDSRHSEGAEDASTPDADAGDQTSERHHGDGYETDDERDRTRDGGPDEERDSAVGGSSEDRAVDSAAGDGPDSDWVGPRSVSPYVEQQLPNGGDDGSPDAQQEQEAADSAVERDSVFSDNDKAAPEPAQSRPDSESQRRPPSRVSLVYTYASGPKVLSHVELAPETEAERGAATENDNKPTEGSDEKNGKHVTFEEDVAAAANVRIRRKRSDAADVERGEAKQWKELRKKNKERRKNRTSNTFRSSSTTGSLMNDKRLIKTGNIGTLVLHGQPQPRWNAYFANARALSNSGGPSLTDIIRYQEARRRDAGLQNGPAARRGLGTGRRRDERVRTPPAVAGRKHYRVQTEPYLEEIRDRRVEADRAVQTDPLLDRPSTPLFVPSKTGADVATQIYEGDLFDFELESAPILEVLVGKTVEQSLLEVMEEEELETLKEHQRRFEERRQAELAEQQRLAERERRHVEEKERRMSQRRSALEQETETEAKVAASALAQSYLADMVPAVFSNLRQKGFFFNGVERDIEMTFMPWLRDAVEQELDKVLTGREVLDELILDAVRKRREELEQRPSLSARLPPAPLAEPAAEPSAAAADGDGPVSAAASAAGGPAGDEAEDDSEEEEADDSGEEEAAADEGSDDDDAGKGAEEGAPDDDEP
ncbi:uncharacterized protein LOC122393170 isoform X2 [Amphibalanus amphitrite]|uniref:uncharacterized protein LOC122393170 isoform X2 n=1 Tax=Amphibalanus amphitrite TaxID=1232801 RepID=UPI001C92199E|nr:uncharacterized protein LOC122393170 isoform X2 [Amphibalanus amphitrite]